MRQVNKELLLEERAEAERFFERIGERDAAYVKQLIELVDTHADDYFSSGELEKVYGYFNGGEAFFAVYGIGGNLTKEGERPDVDIMVVTNMRYQDGFTNYGEDRMNDLVWEKEVGPLWEDPESLWKDVEPLWRKMNSKFRGDMEVKREGELPDNYNLGITRGKCIITLTPLSGARKIDVVYVKSMVAHGSPDLPDPGEEYKPPEIDDSQMNFNSEADFVSKDLGIDGQPLAKVVLYHARTSDIKKPQLRWRP